MNISNIMTDKNTTQQTTDTPEVGEVRITNVEEKGSPTFGIAEKLKNKLQAKNDKTYEQKAYSADSLNFGLDIKV
mgnify:CR=1 FL=1